MPRSASRKEIQGKFYEVSSSIALLSCPFSSPSAILQPYESRVSCAIEYSPTRLLNFAKIMIIDGILPLQLSKLYHPDAPSTSASGSLESRTAKFQAISQSYAILSDDSARRQYDQTTEGSFGRRPGYTTGGGHEAGGRSGFGGGNAAWSPTAGDNAARRERANYAWSHPRRNRMGGDGNPSASAERAAPLRNRPGEGPATNTQDLFSRFAAREVRSRARAAANRHHTSARDYNAGTSGTEGFGSKAAEESRLINESGVKRSGQVFFVFAGTFAVGVMFAGAGKHDRGRA